MQGFADVNGIKLHYEAAGAGPAVIFIHGHYLDSRMWDRQFNAFAHDSRVIRYDLRGYGQSEFPVQSFSHAGDLFGLLRYLGTESACLVGHSLGASIALEFALAYPARITGFVAVAPFLRGHPTSAPHLQRLEHTTAVARQHGAGRARRNWLEKDPLLGPVRRKPAIYARIAEVAGAYTFADVLRPPLEVRPDAPLHRLSDVAAPSLILAGELDAPDIRAAAHALHAALPNARTMIIPEAGHWPQLEQPEAINWALGDFLRNRVLEG